MSFIGLCGGHRVGKTTLAKAYAAKHGIDFLETPTSAIFAELGHRPDEKFDFRTRLDIQEVILKRFDALYARLHPGKGTITDRTPLDLLMYTMSEAVGDACLPSDQDRFAKYAIDCFGVTNRRFGTLLLVQPGIPLVVADGKAALNSAYIEHLTTLVLGLTVDERLKTSHFYIPRHIVDLDERVRAVESAMGKSMYQAQHALGIHLQAGGRLQ